MLNGFLPGSPDQEGLFIQHIKLILGLTKPGDRDEARKLGSQRSEFKPQYCCSLAGMQIISPIADSIIFIYKRN